MPYNLGQYQAWRLDLAFPLGTEVIIKNRISKKVVEVSQDKENDGNPMVVATEKGFNRQIWKVDQNIDGTFRFYYKLLIFTINSIFLKNFPFD